MISSSQIDEIRKWVESDTFSNDTERFLEISSVN